MLPSLCRPIPLEFLGPTPLLLLPSRPIQSTRVSGKPSLRQFSSDAAAFSERLALFVRRTGVALVTLRAEEDMDWPDRTDAFAWELSRVLVPQPDEREHPGAYSPWQGFIKWARTPGRSGIGRSAHAAL